jgi:HK97 family phage prohead protease
MANKKMEYRSLTSELRAEGDDKSLTIRGYAALFGSISKDLGSYRERIAPGAFARSIREGADVKALINHDASHLLGRTKNGTLTLEEDSRGLKFVCILNPDSQAARDYHASIKRGDMDECSFAFTVPEGGDVWDEAQDASGQRYKRRTLRDVNLLDVSAVTYPAYNSTSVGARSAQPDYQDNAAAWLASKKRFLANLTEQIEREALCGSILDRVMNTQTDEQRAEADRELQERMCVAAGRATR